MNNKYKKNRENSAFFLSVFAALGLLVLLCSGCGKKAPPLPPLNEMISSPSNLNYSLNNGRIILKWTYSHKNNNSSKCRSFKIFRAKRALSDTACKGCPLDFKEINSVPSTQLYYSEKIKHGYEYFYRIRAYSKNDVLSGISNTIEVSYK